MKPRERRETGQSDLFKARLDQIIDMGHPRVRLAIQESLAVAAKIGALKPSELTAVLVDTTVQPKNVAHPTDAKLLNPALERLVRLAKKHEVHG